MKKSFWIAAAALLAAGSPGSARAAFALNATATPTTIGADGTAGTNAATYAFTFTAPLLISRMDFDFSAFGTGTGLGVDLTNVSAADVSISGISLPLTVSKDNAAKTMAITGLSILGATNVTVTIRDVQNPPTPSTGTVSLLLTPLLGATDTGADTLTFDGDTTDADDDGIADGFETYYGTGTAYPSGKNIGLDPTDGTDDPLYDADGDGFGSRREFLGATNPADAASLPHGLSADADSDTIYDVDEWYPGTTLDTDGDTVADASDTDSDGDTILDSVEAGDALLTTPPIDTDDDGTPDFQDSDSDEDGDSDGADNCRLVANPDQADGDSNGVGDACQGDLDGDGVANASDNCQTISNFDQANNDGDSLGDACDDDDDNDGDLDGADNCQFVSNANQADSDGDGVGNACQSDFDGDGLSDANDNCPSVKNEDQLDTDGDSMGDACDDDDDGDLVADADDNCPVVENKDQIDTIGEGKGDACNDDAFYVWGSGGCAASEKPGDTGLVFLIVAGWALVLGAYGRREWLKRNGRA